MRSVWIWPLAGSTVTTRKCGSSRPRRNNEGNPTSTLSTPSPLRRLDRQINARIFRISTKSTKHPSFATSSPQLSFDKPGKQLAVHRAIVHLFVQATNKAHVVVSSTASYSRTASQSNAGSVSYSATPTGLNSLLPSIVQQKKCPRSLSLADCPLKKGS